MANNADDALIERWQTLDREHSRVSAALDHALEKAHGVSACELGVLQRLAAQDDGSVRIQDLCECAQRSQSAVSRIVGRLEAEGLLTRTVFANDRRGVTPSLTAAGRRRVAAAEATQRRVLAETLI